MKLNVLTIPHSHQRYDTVGDYWKTRYSTEFRVSEMPDWRSEAAVFLHEFVEAMLCKQAGITFEQVDEWDLLHGDDPGALPNCPYGRQHQVAEALERAFCQHLGLTWRDHEENVNGAGAAGRPGRSAGENGGAGQAGRGLPGQRDRLVSDPARGEAAAADARAAQSSGPDQNG